MKVALKVKQFAWKKIKQCAHVKHRAVQGTVKIVMTKSDPRSESPILTMNFNERLNLKKRGLLKKREKNIHWYSFCFDLRKQNHSWLNGNILCLLQGHASPSRVTLSQMSVCKLMLPGQQPPFLQ